MPGRNRLIDALLVATAVLMSATLFAATPEEEAATLPADVYDEAAYTQYVEDTMNTLDQLYLDFLDAKGVDAAKARITREEFLTTAHELMHRMNAKYDDQCWLISWHRPNWSRWLLIHILNSEAAEAAHSRYSLATLWRGGAGSLLCSRQGAFDHSSSRFPICRLLAAD
jgi:hypothetical protein